MCGIAGFSGQFDESLLARMSDRIAHRGPDDQGTYFDALNRLGLAHRRLSIIDTSSAGHQPMSDATRSVTIVFNGEIYNYRELRAELIRKGVQFKGHSDTEVLLYQYLENGEQFLTKLNGIYAFALWDHRTGQLLVARDGLGVKPLYYHLDQRGFLFASELKALLRCETVSRELNPAALLHHLTLMWCPAPHSILLGVRKLEPGEALLVREGRIVKRWFHYSLPAVATDSSISAAGAVSDVRNLLRQAVERQMVSDVPVGAFLSGGLDSSAVVACAAKLSSSQPFECFTIRYNNSQAREDGIVDDLPYARQVASHLGVRLHEVEVDESMGDVLPKMIYHLDEPQGDLAPLNALFIAQQARTLGIKVLLSGAGGDDIFSGYRRHQALDMERYWIWLPEQLRSALARTSAHLPAAWPLGRRVAKAFAKAQMPADQRMLHYFNWLDPALANGLLSNDLRLALARQQDTHPMHAALAALPSTAPPLSRALFLESRYFLPDHNLNYTDKVSMAAGVEVRVPLLDRDLVHYAFSLPSEYKQRGPIGKWVLKEAMRGILPDNILHRPKTGFSVPLRKWMRGSLGSLFANLTCETTIRHRGLFDAGAVRKLKELNDDGIIDASYSILALGNIELWCRLFLDSTSAPDSVSEKSVGGVG